MAFTWKIFSSPEPMARVSYCDRVSSIRLSFIRKLFALSTSTPEPFDGFDETWKRWSSNGPLQVVLSFSQIFQGLDPGSLMKIYYSLL